MVCTAARTAAIASVLALVGCASGTTSLSPSQDSSGPVDSSQSDPLVAPPDAPSDLPPDAHDAGGETAPPDSAADLQPDVDLCADKTCDDDLDCTDDRCVEGDCLFEVQAGWCAIDDVCYQGGTTASGTECRSCNPARAQRQWTDDEMLCDDDALPCTDTVCEAGTCGQRLQADRCLIEGACRAAGDLHPANPCRTCDPARATDTWQDRADGDPCPVDELDCTADRCNGGQCVHPVESGTCLIDGNCYARDARDPQNSCQACLPATSQTAWTDRGDGAGCDADDYGCTSDICSGGSCTHPLQAGFCLIDDTCHAEGTSHPTTDCRSCITALATDSWSVSPDGTACTTDPLSCTDDRCDAGSCTHPLLPGRCLIANVCYQEDQVVNGSGGCAICLPARSSDSATVADGLACNDGDANTAVDTCVDQQCRGFTAYEWEWFTSDQATLLTGVAAAPGGVWAVGRLTDWQGYASGFVARLIKGNNPSPVIETGVPMTAIHHRLATGWAGTAYYYNGSTWVSAPSIAAHLGTRTTYDTWGASLPDKQVYYLGGEDGTVARCTTVDDGSSFTCADATGIPATALITGVSGTTAGGSEGRSWALRYNGIEHVYSSPDGGQSAYSAAPPEGCVDEGTTGACAVLPGRLLDIWAASSTEVWAVGEQGIVLHFDGAGWTRVAIPTLDSPPQSAYTFRAVFVDGDLVVLAGDRNFSNQFHDMILVFYNSDLERWYPPRWVTAVPYSDPTRAAFRFYDAGGVDASALHLVGSIWSTSGDEQRALFLIR